MITVKIPKRFIEDHADRSCLRADDGTEYGKCISVEDVTVRELKKHYIVALTDAQAKELLSDANYYRDGGGGGMDFCEMGGLIASAKATYNALIKAGMQHLTNAPMVW